jgi:biotin carboxylase
MSAKSPRSIVFVAPVIDLPAARFLRALAKLENVRVLGVVHRAPPADCVPLFHDVVQIARPLDAELIAEAVGVLRTRHGVPHRVLGVLEAVQLQVAAARERFGVPGESLATATLFRDKAKMKDALRAAGLPVARHAVIAREADAAAFVREVGFPIVLKPIDGVAAASTSRVTNEVELAQRLRAMEMPVLAEEMLVGDEYSFETLTVKGEPRAWSYSRYLPGCLEVVEKPWIQWACVLPREVDARIETEVRPLAFKALHALGMENGLSHLEWFARADGTLAIGEIAQRPPGPQLFQMTGLVNGIDPHLAWARAAVDGEFDAPWKRASAAGTVFVRGQGRGRVSGIAGLRELHESIGPWVVETKLPRPGEPKNEGYEGDGYIVVRHPETEIVKALIATVMQTVRIHYDDLL